MLQVHADIDTVKVVVKNVPDYAAGKEKNDLGFLTFDLQVRFTPSQYDRTSHGRSARGVQRGEMRAAFLPTFSATPFSPTYGAI